MSWPHLGASRQKPSHSQAHQHDQMSVRRWKSHTQLSDNRWTKEESLISSSMVDFNPSVVLRPTNMDVVAAGPVELEQETLLLVGRGRGGSEHMSIDG